MTDRELTEAEQLARRYGSSNCWTGTSGTLAAYLLLAVRTIKEERNEQLLQVLDDAVVPPGRSADEQGRC